MTNIQDGSKIYINVNNNSAFWRDLGKMDGYFDLDSLAENVPVMLPELAGFYKQKCEICLYSQGHKSGVLLKVVHGENNKTFEIRWSDIITPEILRANADLVEATEYGACALSFLIIRELTNYLAFEQAVRGEHFDYYLTQKETKSLFDKSARLEATGILKEEGANTIDNRIKIKLDRLVNDNSLPTYIVVVEFKTPSSKMVEK